MDLLPPRTTCARHLSFPRSPRPEGIHGGKWGFDPAAFASYPETTAEGWMQLRQFGPRRRALRQAGRKPMDARFDSIHQPERRLRDSAGGLWRSPFGTVVCLSRFQAAHAHAHGSRCLECPAVKACDAWQSIASASRVCHRVGSRRQSDESRSSWRKSKRAWARCDAPSVRNGVRAAAGALGLPARGFSVDLEGPPGTVRACSGQDGQGQSMPWI